MTTRRDFMKISGAATAMTMLPSLPTKTRAQIEPNPHGETMESFPVSAVHHLCAHPEFRYTATNKKVPEKDFSVRGRLFGEKKATLDFVRLWSDGEISRVVSTEGTAFSEKPHIFYFAPMVEYAVSNYIEKYSLSNRLLTRMNEPSTTLWHQGEKHYVSPWTLSSSTHASQRDIEDAPLLHYSHAVRSASQGISCREDATLLFLLNSAPLCSITKSDITEAYIAARSGLWKKGISHKATVLTLPALQQLVADCRLYLQPPKTLNDISFGHLSFTKVYPIDNSLLPRTNASPVENTTAVCYLLGYPGALGIINVHRPLKGQIKDGTLRLDTTLSMVVFGKYVSKATVG